MEEVGYLEHELGNLLLGESRDLPPLYNQLSARPVRDAQFLWRCKEAAEVSWIEIDTQRPQIVLCKGKALCQVVMIFSSSPQSTAC